MFVCFVVEAALFCCAEEGPRFGGRADLLVCNNSNEGTNIYNSSNLGNTYKHPEYAYGTKKAKSFLSGEKYLKTVDIEVYTKD